MSLAIEKIFDRYFQGDKVIWGVLILLSLFSLLAVYTASGALAFTSQNGNTVYYVLKHGIILLLGIFLVYLVHLIPYGIYSKLSQILVILCVPLLFITLFMGSSINSASRWISIPGIGISFQTSDLAKLALMMFIARHLSLKQSILSNFKQGFVPIIAWILVICGLILPANFSTAALLLLTSIILLFIGRVKITYLLSLAATGIVVLVLFVLVVKAFNIEGTRLDTWIARIENYNSGESEDNYQAEQAKIAIVKGGVFNLKPGKSTQRNFLPQSYSDFIYAIIIEEYGLFGGVLVLLLYLILLYRVGLIIKNCNRTFPAFLAIGLTLLIVMQALINMAVAVNLLPVTGQTLPLISMGGTSLLFTCTALGIILSISRSNAVLKNEQNVGAQA